MFKRVKFAVQMAWFYGQDGRTAGVKVAKRAWVAARFAVRDHAAQVKRFVVEAPGRWYFAFRAAHFKRVFDARLRVLDKACDPHLRLANPSAQRMLDDVLKVTRAGQQGWDMVDAARPAWTQSRADTEDAGWREST